MKREGRVSEGHDENCDFCGKLIAKHIEDSVRIKGGKVFHRELCFSTWRKTISGMTYTTPSEH